jgi:Icc-related predicted phosphoesterase
MSICFVGDIHGEFEFFEKLPKRVELPSDMTFIQVGDFGWYPQNIQYFPQNFPNPVYFIDGNHEHFPLIRGVTEIKEVKPNLFYVPRGTVMEIDGWTIGFIGGGESVDRYWRTKEIDWFPDERVTEEDVNKLLNCGKKIDILVTHAPPKIAIDYNFTPIRRESWSLPRDWEDVSAQRIEHLWNNLGRPRLYCGHMHRSVKWNNVRILDINETEFLPPKSELENDDSKAVS